MIKRLPFSLLHSMGVISRELTSVGCPGCAGDDPRLVWRHDRYFLRVDLSICRGCGLVYLARGLVGEAAHRFYDSIYPRLMQVHVAHCSYFSAASLGALLEKHGFTPTYVSKEAQGIYPGNLRIFARPTSSCRDLRGGLAPQCVPVAPAPEEVETLALRIIGQIRPLSIANGYPRAASRLLKIAATGQ